jgi:serine/threonine protein kinase
MTRLTKEINLNNYQDLQLIGSGTFGDIYRALDIKSNKTIVIKKISKRLSEPFNPLQPNPRLIAEKTILREVSILSHLRYVCPNGVLCYLDFMEDDDDFYIITEYLGNYITLKELTHNNKDYHKIIIPVIFNLLNSLETIHRVGVAHRDIKPENIMVNPQTSEIKYIDFGLACSMNDCYIQSSQPIGTPYYTAPEIISHTMTPNTVKTITKKLKIQPKDNISKWFNNPPKTLQQWFKTDYWSLGLTILELITGTPFILDWCAQNKIQEPDDINDLMLRLVDVDTLGGVSQFTHNYQSDMVQELRPIIDSLTQSNPDDRILMTIKHNPKTGETIEAQYDDTIDINFED